MFNLFSRPAKVHAELTRAAFSYLVTTSPEGSPTPSISDSYYAKSYGVVLWSCGAKAGFLVLQSVTGIWAVVGAESGVCDLATLCHQFAVPQDEAVSLCEQMAGLRASRHYGRPDAPAGSFSFTEG